MFKILDKPIKNGQRFLNFHKNGVISPNLAAELPGIEPRTSESRDEQLPTYYIDYHCKRCNYNFDCRFRNVDFKEHFIEIETSSRRSPICNQFQCSRCSGVCFSNCPNVLNLSLKLGPHFNQHATFQPTMFILISYIMYHRYASYIPLVDLKHVISNPKFSSQDRRQFRRSF